MKIVFLDIDGVMMSLASHKRSKDLFGELPLLRCSRSQRFDAQAVQNLNELCRITGAKIVLSSCWRSYYQNTAQMKKAIKRANEIMREQGVMVEVVGVTPELPHRKYRGRNIGRGREIQRWMDTQLERIESYVILDDDSDFLALQKSHLVKTSYETGAFTDWKYVREAIKILRPLLTTKAAD